MKSEYSAMRWVEEGRKRKEKRCDKILDNFLNLVLKNFSGYEVELFRNWPITKKFPSWRDDRGLGRFWEKIE